MPSIGEIQVADVPGRFEPGTGEVNLRAVGTVLRGAGYNGVVGLRAGASGGPDLESGDAVFATFRTAFDV